MVEDTSLLRRLLLTAGYRLEERPGGLLATRVTDQQGVLIVDGLRSPSDLEGELPSGLIHRTLLYSEEPGREARQVAAERGMEVIDPSTLGPALGEILLARPAASLPTPETLQAPATVFPDGERMVRPRIGRREAEAIGAVDGFRYTLRYVPFFVANYRVRTASAHGGPGRLSDHQVAVNALSGRAELWEPGERELVSEVDEPHERLEPLLSEAQVLTTMLGAIRRRHTVNVDHSEQHEGALIIERRRVPPGADDLRVGPLAIVHVPFWYIEGPDGRIIVDAVQGIRLEREGDDRGE